MSVQWSLTSWLRSPATRACALTRTSFHQCKLQPKRRFFSLNEDDGTLSNGTAILRGNFPFPITILLMHVFFLFKMLLINWSKEINIYFTKINHIVNLWNVYPALGLKIRLNGFGMRKRK